MNETEIYFARQNFLFNLGIYILIGIGILLVLALIIEKIYYKWKWDIKPKLEKRRKSK